MIDVSLYYCVYSRDCEPIIATLATTFLVRSISKAPNFTIRMCVLSIVLILYIYIYTRVSKDRESGGRRYRTIEAGLRFRKRGGSTPFILFSVNGVLRPSFHVGRRIYRGTKFPIERIQEYRESSFELLLRVSRRVKGFRVIPSFFKWNLNGFYFINKKNFVRLKTFR